MNIILTGTPGTGKTEVSKELAKSIKAQLIDVNKLIEKHKFFSKVDKEDNAKIVNLRDLEDYLRNYVCSDEKFIIESHLLCELSLPADFVFVLRTHPKLLRSRISKRKYSKIKIENNISCEILDYCLIKSEANYTKNIIYEINTTNKTPKKVVKEILEVINGKRKTKHIDWSKKIFKDKIDIKKLKDL